MNNKLNETKNNVDSIEFYKSSEINSNSEDSLSLINSKDFLKLNIKLNENGEEIYSKASTYLSIYKEPQKMILFTGQKYVSVLYITFDNQDIYDYLSRMDEESLYTLECMIAYEVFDLDSFSATTRIGIKITTNINVNIDEFQGMKISRVLYNGKYRTRRGYLTNHNSCVKFINRSNYYNRHKNIEDIRDSMKYELYHFIYTTDMDDSEVVTFANTLDDIINKYQDIIKNMSDSSIYRRMYNALMILKSLNIDPFDLGIDIYDEKHIKVSYISYIRYGVSILDGLHVIDTLPF